MNKTIYKDRKGVQISYGDILRCVDIEKDHDFENPLATKLPAFMLCVNDGETMMYCTTNDEYWDINDCKLKTDKIDELGGFEIFIDRETYEELNNGLH